MPTTVLLVRHAAAHNPKDIVYGRLPRFGLSTAGREQAEKTARFLAARPVAAIYTSPLLRARQTARILTHYHPQLPTRTSRHLIEVLTGYQGEPNSILKPSFSFYDPLKSPEDETLDQVFDRMVRFLRVVLRRHAGQTAVAVTHADPIAILRVGLEAPELSVEHLHSTVYPDRGSITQINVAPGQELRLSYFNPANGI